jgi:transcriptional regulator of acetoin/glycerol metabolism
VRREHLLAVLEACGWNRTRAAAILKVNRKTVYRMMERFGLQMPER